MSVDPVSALDPCPRVMVVPAPVVQVTLTVPVPASGVEALVETGSYAPKATAAVEIRQFADTEAVTDRLDVAVVAASVVEAAPIASSMTPVSGSVLAMNV